MRKVACVYVCVLPLLCEWMIIIVFPVTLQFVDSHKCVCLIKRDVSVGSCV